VEAARYLDTTPDPPTTGIAPTAFAFALARAATEPDRRAATAAVRRGLDAGDERAAA